MNEQISIDITLSAGNPVSYTLTTTSVNGFNKKYGLNCSKTGFFYLSIPFSNFIVIINCKSKF